MLAIIIPILAKLYVNETSHVIAFESLAENVTDGLFVRAEEIWVDPTTFKIKLNLYLRPMGELALIPGPVPNTPGEIKPVHHIIAETTDFWVESTRHRFEKGSFLPNIGTFLT